MRNKIVVALLLATLTAPAWAVGTMIVMAYYGLATAGAMTAGMIAAAFVINFAVSTLVSRVFSKKPPKIQDNGVRQQIPPASTNSLPIVYGQAFLGGTFVDAVLSTNQKVMWYTMAISHISPDGEFTFDKTQFYYGDRLITFDTTEFAKVVSLTDGAGNVDTKIADNLYIYLYRSNQAGVITNLDNGGTSPGSSLPDVILSNTNGVPAGLEWPSTGRQMNGLAFAIVKLIYSQEDDAVQLQQITFKCNQGLYGTGVAKPGDVWYDYIRNPVYGGDIDDSLVDQASPYALSVYSDELITYTDNNGNPATQPRYRINGVLDTGETVLENLDKILVAGDSWMAYDAPTGKWSIVINKAESPSFAFNDSNIIGDIRVSTIDINQSLNQIEARFPSKLNKDIPDYVFLKTPPFLLYPNEPVNKYSLSFDLVNDSVQAQYLANRILEQAREDLIVTIKTTYAGIQVNAGDIVSITSSVYGWSAKLFRTTKVNEVALDDGSLGASLELSEYNAQVYDDKPITEFQPAGNTDIPNSGFFSALSAPTVTDQLPNAAIPSFAVNCVMPSTGRITSVYLYYTTVAVPIETDWQLLGSQSLTGGNTYNNLATVKFTNIVLPTNTYYFAFTVANELSKSVLSPQSTGYAWAPNPTSTNVSGTFLAQFSPPVLQVPYANSTPSFTGITPQLYGSAAGGAVDYVDAGSDTDTLFVNNSWRIGASSTTGLGDIVKSNITIGNPTDGGTYALFPQPTAMPANPATISVPVRYKDDTGIVYQSATAICQLTWNIAGDNGVSGSKTATVSLYQWATTTPSNPSGDSTYTWATASHTAYTGGNGWTIEIPANPGIPGIRLFSANKSIVAPANDVTTIVDWTAGYTIQAISENGANGLNGLQSATAVVYQWAITLPSAPVGSSIYTWSSNSFSPTPIDWTLTGGTSPSIGYTLWAARVNLVDSASATTSSINWSTATIAAVGYAGTNGTNGTNAQVLTLTATSEAMTFDGAGIADPASQTITFTANLQNLTGTATFTCTAFNASNTSLGTITLGGSGNTRTLTNAQFVTFASTAYVRVTATLSGFSDTVTVTRLQDGTNAVVGYLTNESVTLAASSTGVVSSFTPANGNFKVFSGTTDVSASSTFSLVSSTGCTAAISAGGAITVSAMSADSATATFQAVYSGATIQKILSLAKSFAGTTGATGTTGASARICYTKTTLSSLASTPSTITTAGSSSFPPNNSWGTGTIWQATPPAIIEGESVYQSDGIYSPTTGNTVWNVPYLSALKVGSLSAITVNTGALNVTNALTIGTLGSIKGGQTDYKTGTGFFLGYSVDAYKFSIGSSTNYLGWDGTNLEIVGKGKFFNSSAPGINVELGLDINSAVFRINKEPNTGGLLPPAYVIDKNCVGAFSSVWLSKEGAPNGYFNIYDCRLATTANITLSGTPTIDGKATVIGYRILVKNQTTQSQNGVYVVASGAWTRATDADSWDEFVSSGLNRQFVTVTEGTTNAGKQFYFSGALSGTVGVTAITYAQFTDYANNYYIGEALYITPNGYAAITASDQTFINTDLVTFTGSRREAQLRVAARATVGGISQHSSRFYHFNTSNVVISSGIAATQGGNAFYAETGGYGPFTGTHDGLLAKTQSIEVGDILVDDQLIYKKDVSNTLFSVKPSVAPNTPATGIFVNSESIYPADPPAALIQEVIIENYIDHTGEERSKTVVVPIPHIDQLADDYYLVNLNAVGEGQVNVCGEGGNIQPGDLIVTSSMPGKGMKQSDNSVRSITVARAREGATFSSPTEIKMIACFYVCG